MQILVSDLGIGGYQHEQHFQEKCLQIRKLKFHAFRSVGLLARFFIFSRVTQRMHLISHMKIFQTICH